MLCQWMLTEYSIKRKVCVPGKVIKSSKMSGREIGKKKRKTNFEDSLKQKTEILLSLSEKPNVTEIQPRASDKNSEPFFLVLSVTFLLRASIFRQEHINHSTALPMEGMLKKKKKNTPKKH